MIKRILGKIGVLFDRNSYHSKRGYRIRELSTEIAGLALVEETVELQAELMNPRASHMDVLEEAADVLICFTRILHDKGINLSQLEAAAEAKLRKVWTDDPSKVTANKPGFTRRGR